MSTAAVAAHPQIGRKPFHPHVTPLWQYLAVFALLLVMTAITVGVFRLDAGHRLVAAGVLPADLAHSVNMAISMVIATIKATCVALIFMHLLYDHKVYSLILAGGLVFLGLFIAVTLFDVLRRGDIDDFTRAPIVERAALYDSLPAPADAGHGEVHGAAPASGDPASGAAHGGH